MDDAEKLDVDDSDRRLRYQLATAHDQLATAQRELREMHLAIKAVKPELTALLAMPGVPASFYAPVRKLLAQL